MNMMHVSLIILLSSTCYAFQLPFKFPFFKAPGYVTDNLLNVLPTPTPRIAIIGAGAGGTSAAFWISKAKTTFGLDVEVDVYERESYIGGRSMTVHPYNDTNLPAFELGASLFSETNKNLWRASQEFNLTRLAVNTSGAELGVWDGENLLLNWSGGGSWWETLQAFWRYGFSAPKRTEEIVQSIAEQFSGLYAMESRKWDNVTNLAASFGWTSMAAQNLSTYLENHGINKRYIREVVEAATRLNYGQNVDDIHALQGVFSMASSGVRIQGGNSQLFEQFLKRSGAKVLLNTAVDRISPKSATSRLWTVHSGSGSEDYRAVIIAAPFHDTSIELPPAIASQIPEQLFSPLHVTLLTTTLSSPNAEYFAFPTSFTLPRRILTTYEGSRQGGKEPEFFSLSYHGSVRDGEWTVKILSKEPISDEWLAKVFLDQVGWIYRKEWRSSRKLSPTTSFPSVRLDQGLYYVNAFESLISTTEMATIASRNVVDLLLNEEFGSSICGPRISSVESQQQNLTTSESLVLGWDC